MTRRIILAEESISIQKTIEHILSGADCRIEIFHEGEGALDAVRKSPPDCVIADVGLEGIDGYSLSSTIKKDQTLQNLRVILMIPKSDEVNRQRINESGADDFIVKPFEPEQFLKTLPPAITSKVGQEEGGEGKSPGEGHASVREDVLREMLYDALPEIERALIEELKRSIEEKIPYTLEKIVTGRMKERESGGQRETDGRDQQGPAEDDS